MTYDCPPFVADCRVRAVTDLLTHTWDPVVLMALRYGGRRRRELLADIGGISDKALTQSLRRLMDNGPHPRSVTAPRLSTHFPAAVRASSTGR